MRVCETIEETRQVLKEERSRGKCIGFVPTMGYLHEGHLSLVDIARKHSSTVVMSIFVNPLQFGPTEDYEEYPRDLNRDIRLASERGVDLLFTPGVAELYPEENLTFIEVKKITERLCGRSRPEHFKGVMTVVAKLFNIVEPDIAVFGQKDAQQAIAIKRMVKDLNYRCRVHIGPTVREKDGLAMSSRNRYISAGEREHALLLYKSLLAAKKSIEEGEKDAAAIKERIRMILEKSPHVKIDYISITDTMILEECEEVSGEILIAIAAYVGKTRLIDNLILET